MEWRQVVHLRDTKSLPTAVSSCEACLDFFTTFSKCLRPRFLPVWEREKKIKHQNIIDRNKRNLDNVERLQKEFGQTHTHIHSLNHLPTYLPTHVLIIGASSGTVQTNNLEIFLLFKSCFKQSCRTLPICRHRLSTGFELRYKCHAPIIKITTS